MNTPALVKITDFLNLSVGWCYGEGTGFSVTVVDTAKQLITSLLSYGFNTLDAFPGLNGEIRVTAYVQAHYLEFTIENKDSITFVYEVDDKEQVYQENLGFCECIEQIKKLKHLCNSYDSFIQDISTKTKTDSKVSRFSLPQQTEVFLYFAQAVPWKPAVNIASTYGTTTQTSVESRPYFGYLTRQFCQATM